VAGIASIVGVVLLLSPLHLVGAILIVLGVAALGFTLPDAGLWLVLLLFPVYPLLSKVVQVNFGVTGAALLLASAWKEVALGAVLVARLFALANGYRAGRRWPVRPAVMDVLAVALILLVAAGVAIRHDSLAVNTARLLLFPVGVYIALRLSPLDPGKYLKAAVVIASGIAVYAIAQTSLFGFAFVTSYWGQPDLSIPYTFVAQYLQGPRASGTFASPNELGFALTAFILMAAALLIVKPAQVRWAAVALFALLIALGLTFSRSAIVGTGAGLVLLLVAAWRYAPSPRQTFKYLALAVVPALLLSGVVYEARGGTALVQSTIASLVSSSSVTDTGGPTPVAGASPTPATTPTPGGPVIDPSTQGHLESIAAAWAVVEAHPLGLGLGTVGSRADPLTSERPQYVFESWYLTMGVSLGWLGLAWAAFLPLAMFLTALMALRRGRTLAELPLLGLSIAMAIVSYLLPTMMEPQMAMLPWALAAFAVSAAPGEPTVPALAGQGRTTSPAPRTVSGALPPALAAG
jgi:hypothetical protein